MTSPDRAPPQVLAFGRGELVVTTGLYDKAPAVFIRRAIQPGTVGEPADRERVPLDCLADDEIVMTFGAASQCEAVANAIVGSGNARATLAAQASAPVSMRGFFASLTPEQQAAALAYRGPDNHPGPPPQPGDTERRIRLLRIQGLVDSFVDKNAARNAVSALDAQFLLDQLDTAQSALAKEERDHELTCKMHGIKHKELCAALAASRAECARLTKERDDYRARAYALAEAESQLKDELARLRSPTATGEDREVARQVLLDVERCSDEVDGAPKSINAIVNALAYARANTYEKVAAFALEQMGWSTTWDAACRAIVKGPRERAAREPQEEKP